MGLAAFEIYLDSILSLLGPHHLAAHKIVVNGFTNSTVTPFKVIWRGNTLASNQPDNNILAQMNDIARERVAAYGIPFIDTVATMQSTPNLLGCTSTFVHIGSHEFHNYQKNKQAEMNWTMSSMVTNEVMRYICPVPEDLMLVT